MALKTDRGVDAAARLIALRQPTSQLTMSRPDIWYRGLVLAMDLTGYLYLPKWPAADGTIFACGGSYYPPTKYTIDEQIKRQQDHVEWLKKTYPDDPVIEEAQKKLQELKRTKKSFRASVLVPDGEMEWLLHEVGHWIAASPAERLLPNYGDGHELEAWAFEELILSQHGPARSFAPVTQRDGTAFEKAGPLPRWAFDHVDQRLTAERIEIEPFRQLWAEWVAWGRAQSTTPWGEA